MDKENCEHSNRDVLFALSRRSPPEKWGLPIHERQLDTSNMTVHVEETPLSAGFGQHLLSDGIHSGEPPDTALDAPVICAMQDQFENEPISHKSLDAVKILTLQGMPTQDTDMLAD